MSFSNLIGAMNLGGAYLQRLLTNSPSEVLCSRARLHRPLKKSPLDCFVTGPDFSRANKPFIFVITSGLQPARDLLLTFSAACSAVHKRPLFKEPALEKLRLSWVLKGTAFRPSVDAAISMRL